MFSWDFNLFLIDCEILLIKKKKEKRSNQREDDDIKPNYLKTRRNRFS